MKKPCILAATAFAVAGVLCGCERKCLLTTRTLHGGYPGQDHGLTNLATSLVTNNHSSIDKGLYGAMRAGFLIAQAGGTEQEMQQLFTQINSGGVSCDALQLWLNSAARKCPPLVRKSMELGWSARDAGKSLEEIVALYESLKTNTANLTNQTAHKIQ